MGEDIWVAVLAAAGKHIWLFVTACEDTGGGREDISVTDRLVFGLIEARSGSISSVYHLQARTGQDNPPALEKVTNMNLAAGFCH